MNHAPQDSINPISSKKTVLEYLSPDTVILNLPIILTCDKKLTIGMPYLYIEGSHSFAVRLLDVWDENEFVYLTIQDIQTNKSFKISWNLEYRGAYWLWSLASLDYLINLTDES